MFTIEQSRAFFGFLKQVFNQHCSELNTLDSFAGDGDHGFTMQRGFDKVLEEIRKSESTDFAELFDIASVAFAENSGGAIGPILSSFFAEGGVVFKGKTDLSTRDFSLFFQKGVEAVMQIGGAHPSEKTILDAMQPAFAYLHENTALPLAQALENTWHIGLQAAMSTKGMIAKHGRAKFLGERSKEFQDAGATSFALIIQALWKAANNEKPIF